MTSSASVSISEAYHAARRHAQHVADMLSVVKDAPPGSQERRQAITDVSGVVNTMSGAVRDLNPMVDREPRASQASWRAKIHALAQDENMFRQDLQRLMTMQHEAESRRELLSRPESGLASRPIAARMHHERQVLERADEEVTVMIDRGTETLNALRRQRDAMKGAQRRLLDVVSRLGLSKTVLRLVERRHGQDRLIVYGGMAITTLVIIALLYYFVWS